MRTLLSSSGFMLILIVVCISCSRPATPQMSADLWVRNDTAMVLDEVKLRYETIAWRENPTLLPSSSQPVLWDCGRPSKDIAEVRFVDRDGGKPHGIKVDVSALKALSAGKHEVVISITALDQARVEIDGPPCRYNLLVIEAARQLWVSLHRSGPNEMPSWADLRVHLPRAWTNGMPICPAGGTYTIGSFGNPAKCSVGGEGHTLR